MIDSNDSVQLSGYCFDVCEILRTVIQGRNPEDLSERVRMAVGDLERCVDQLLILSPSPLSNSRVMCKIELTLRRGMNAPHIEYNKGEIEGYKLEIQGILGTLNLDGNLTVGEHTPRPVPTVPYDAATTSAFWSGTPSARLCRPRI